ncbi:TPA: restriction endonuclease subunit S [Enterococcus faecalis]|uniref:restriction endonuclease subunit S n=2 Tax=Enterococcus TaxID=1350 RepID=UPI0001CB2C65|nr:type I restriction modification DNA specificity domain protein [Enterococcus faecalis S613]EFQ08792.1 type I restriction modification DNA specificity domain protein [Enterococcus faecalis DAPTO 512]EFQ69244.1 type I restriction modification DNA specificity domain protein [Enterococcus faecalis DAPTO 516]MBJ1689973.1 restriction endonuclease subunit S [Enterococcus faecalis]MBU5663374.1 restriction endonuclease subunit S [Enterococcus sp. S183_ASV_20]HAP3759152.1 restriction endonuclease sub
MENLFNYNWELCKLEKLTDFFSGLTYSPDNVQKDGTFVLRSSNVKDNAIISADNVYVRNEVANSEHVQVGDVIVVVRNGSRSLIGKHAPINREMPNTVIGAFMTGLRSPSPKFLNTLLDTQQFNVEIHKNLGATINQITTGEFKRMHFIVPTDEDEKEKIGSLFRQLDDIITLHQRKLDQLKELKKAYLQVMFPAKDERVPKLRFADFEGEWEQCKLGNILTERNTQQSKSKEYPLVSFTVEDGVTPKTERYEREQLVRGDKSSKKYKVTELNDIVYNPANLKFGAIARNHYGKAVFSPIYITFIVNDKLACSSYVEVFITRKDFISYSLKYQQGTVYERQSVSPENLLNMKFLLPNTKEQEFIGHFFEKLDCNSNFHKKKITQLKNLKKSYLQNMFI